MSISCSFDVPLCAEIPAVAGTILTHAVGWREKEQEVKCVTGSPGYVPSAECFINEFMQGGKNYLVFNRNNQNSPKSTCCHE